MAGLEQPLRQNDTLVQGQHITLDAEVLIVGAGPVGLLTAIELAQRSIKVRIIDRWPQQEIKTKAIGLAKGSCQILPAAVVQQIHNVSCKPAGQRVSEVVGNQRKTIIHLTGVDVPGRNEYVTIQCLEQWKTEKFLEDHLRSLGVQVERPMILKDFENKWDLVECTVASADESPAKRLNVSFLVGCDGGSSFVRKKLGFAFEGDTTKETFISCHAKFDNFFAELKDYGDMFFGKAGSGKNPGDPLTPGFCVALPLHDGEHLINLDLDEHQQEEYLSDERDNHGNRKLKELTIDDIMKMYRARSGCPEMTVVPGSVKWITHYRVNSRLSQHFGAGRVYLVGDACHCHSPVGGQGMNMGFQDAKNLAWKLAAAVKKSADHSLLLSYEEERRAIDEKITKGVHLGTSAFSNRSPLVFFLRGRPQRLIGYLLSALPEIAKTGRLWSYSGCSLSYEHWERPSVLSTLKDIFTNGGPTRVYRRRQNLHRWGLLGSRLMAGDQVPPVMVNGANLYDVIKSSRGWTLLLFEGNTGANDEATKNSMPVLTCSQLQAVGNELKQEPDKDGYVAFIDKVAIFPSSDLEAHVAFGVQGQCLFVVRPDTYVGLRCEPVRKGAVTRYFKNIGGLNVPAHPCPPGTSSFDALPAALATFLAAAVALIAYVTQ